MKNYEKGARVKVTSMGIASVHAGQTCLVGGVFNVLYTDEDGDVWIDAKNDGIDAYHDDKICIQERNGWAIELVS